MENAAQNNKRIVKNTAMLYFRSFLVLVIGLYTSRVTLQVLGVDDFGIYNLVGGVVTMSSFLYGSMSTASQRFITYALGEGDFEKLKKIFATSVTLHLILSIIIVVVVELVGGWFIKYKLLIPEGRTFAALMVLHFSAALLFLKVFSIPYDALIVAHEKMSAFAFISIYEVVMKLVIVYLLILFDFDKLILFSFLLLLVGVSQRIIYVAYSKKHFLEAKNQTLFLDKKVFKEMFSFAGWNMFGSGSFLLRNEGIDILMNMFFGVSVNAAKGVCNQVQNAVLQFVTSFQTAVNPQLTKSVATKDFNRTCNLIYQGGRFSFFLLSVFTIPILLNTNEILSLWLVNVPVYAVAFVQLTFIYQLMDVLSRFMINTILATGDIKKYQIIAGSTKLLALPLTYVFLACGGSPMTGLWVNIGLEFCCFLIRLYYNKKRVSLSVRYYVVCVCMKCWAIFALMLLASYAIKCFAPINMILQIALMVLVSVLIIMFIGVTSTERLVIVEKINGKLHRVK